MAANRTMISASWSLQRADHGEQPYWAAILLASCLGQIGLPGGGFGFGYGSTNGIADPPLAFRTPGMEVDGQSAQPRHSGGAHRRMPAAARRALRLQRPQAAPIPTSSSSIGRAAIRSTTTRTSTGCAPPCGGRRPSSCTSRGGRRPRATPTSCCRRPPRSSATTSAARRATASSSPCARRSSRSARRATITRSSPSCRAALGCESRIHQRPRRDGLAAPSL